MFAKTLESLDSLKSQFFHHKAGRVYEALVHGRPRETKGTIDTYLIERRHSSLQTVCQLRYGPPVTYYYYYTGYRHYRPHHHWRWWNYRHYRHWY